MIDKLKMAKCGMGLTATLVVLLAAFVFLAGPATAEPADIIVDDDDPAADYSDIQDAIDNEPDGSRIKVMPGTYLGFVVDARDDLKIEAIGEGGAIVTGSVQVSTYRATDSLTIGVVDSTDIEITNFTVQAGDTDPFTIAYFDSTGKVKHNDVGGNTDNANPGNAIAAFGISSPGTVEIKHNDVHDYGKIGILVNSWDPGAGDFVPSGIHAEITHNTITGTDFADYYRVQDGIQVTYGGSADIEQNDISGNFQSGGSRWTCDGIMAYDADQVKTKGNEVYNNQMGIAIQKYVNNAELTHDKIEQNEWGIYTWNWIPSVIEVKHAKITENDYGWVNWDTDGIVFEHCKLQENIWGMYASASSTVNPVATFNHCDITKNTDIDVEHDSNTLVFNKTKYDTYANYGGGVLIEDEGKRKHEKVKHEKH